MNGTDAAGRVMMAAPSLAQPSINERMNNQEQRTEEAGGRLLQLERQMNQVIAEAIFLRGQLGLPPLPPDHFS